MDRDLAQGQVLDLAQGFPFYPNVQISAGTALDYRDAHVIVITAGFGADNERDSAQLMQEIAEVPGFLHTQRGAAVQDISHQVLEFRGAVLELAGKSKLVSSGQQCCQERLDGSQVAEILRGGCG